VPALLFLTGLVQFNIKKAPSVIGTTMAAYTAVHFANLAINKHLWEASRTVSVYSRARKIPQVNYMYSLGDEGNAVFALFRRIIPLDYWHMYLIAPIIAAFLFVVHYIIKSKNKKASQKSAEVPEV
jgi:hypothetical protein